MRTLSPGAPAAPVRLTEAGFLQVQLAPPDACVQVVNATNGAGQTLITLDGAGSFCRECAQRTALLAGGGLFGIPSDAGELGERVDVSLGLRSCETLGPAAEEPASVVADLRFRPRGALGVSGSARGVLRVDVAVLGEGFFGGHAGSDVAVSWVQQVESLLVDAGLRIDVHALCELDAPGAEVVVQAGDTSQVQATLTRVRAECRGFEPQPDDPRVSVLYVPCLRFEDPLFGTRAALDGYTTHIPGGFAPDGVADAIVLGGGCELPRATDGSGLPLGLARDLAHELGHYLGLFHSVETDGATVDTLADTDGDDLMNARPSLATARGLSPSQVSVIRAHPAVRWPRAGHEACGAAH